MANQQSKLYRSSQDKYIAGICGGLGEYYDVDTTLIRLVWALLIFAGGIGLIAYIAAWIIIPACPSDNKNTTKIKGEDELSHAVEAVQAGTQRVAAEIKEAIGTRQSNKQPHIAAGLIIATLGIFFLLQELLPWFNFDKLWPIILIIFGFAIIFKQE